MILFSLMIGGLFKLVIAILQLDKQIKLCLFVCHSTKNCLDFCLKSWPKTVPLRSLVPTMSNKNIHS